MVKDVLAAIGDMARLEKAPMPVIVFDHPRDLLRFVKALVSELRCPAETLQTPAGTFMYDGIEMRAV